MDRIENEKLRFYLEHQRDIDEWARLSELVPEALQSFLASCRTEVGAVAAGIETRDVTFRDLSDDPAWPKMLLHRPHWHVPNQHWIAVGVGWNRSRVSFRDNDRPWVGLWVHQQGAKGKDLSDALRQLLKPKGYLYTLNWPAYRLEGGQDEEAFWEDLRPLRARIAAAVSATWTDTLGAIEKALGGE